MTRNGRPSGNDRGNVRKYGLYPPFYKDIICDSDFNMIDKHLKLVSDWLEYLDQDEENSKKFTKRAAKIVVE